MDWFHFDPVPPSRTSLGSRRSVEGRQLSRPSSVLNSASVSAQTSPMTRYRNAVRHPDSAANSARLSSSSGSRRWSKRAVPAPDTPEQRLYSQSSRRSYPESPVLSRISSDQAEVHVRARASQERLTSSPVTPLHQKDGNAIDTGVLRRRASGRLSPSSGRPSQTPSRTMKGVNFSGQHSIANVEEDGPSASSSTQPHLEQIKATDYESGIPASTATKTNAGPFEAGQMGKKQRRAAPLSRAGRGEVRKPKLVSERMFESASRQLQSQDDVTPVDETLRSALPTKDPPLYDNIKDKLRQMTVELWLVGAKIAYSLRNWKAMEHQSQQAYNLAADLQWEPFKAQCAFPLGVALSRQGLWVRAYESFEEAEKTNGYYIPRSEILTWLTLAAESYARSAAPFSSAISAAAEGRAPFLTPLDSVVEEKEEFPFPTKENRKPEGEEPPNPEYSLQAAGPLATEPASPTKPEGNSSSAPLQEVSQAVVTRVDRTVAKALRSETSRYGGNTADGSPTDRVPGLPSRPADMPAAVTLATLPAPASIGSPRLYTPKDQAASSPSMAAGTPSLRPALYMLRTGAASSLSEMELPPPFAPKIPPEDRSSEPDQAASPRDDDDPQEKYRKPLDASSLLARKQPFAHLSASRQKVGGLDDVVP
ncbi:MAG: hypothetical protein Q9193_000705, partial [Seirophora villosa]